MRAALLQQVRAYDREIRRSVATDPVCRRLMTAPGVGPITAFAYRATVDDPTLCPLKRCAGAVAGAAHHKSGEHEKIGAI